MFCGRCSTQRRPLPELRHSTPVRVCDTCAAREDSRKFCAAARASVAAPRPTEVSAPWIGAGAGSGVAVPASAELTRSLRVRERMANARGRLTALKWRQLRPRDWALVEITAAHPRRYLLQHTAVEVGRAPWWWWW